MLAIHYKPIALQDQVQVRLDSLDLLVYTIFYAF